MTRKTELWNTLTCAVCKKPVLQSGINPRFTCSSLCAFRWREEKQERQRAMRESENPSSRIPTTKTCAVCGKVFARPHGQPRHVVTCGKACHYALVGQRVRETVRADLLRQRLQRDPELGQEDVLDLEDGLFDVLQEDFDPSHLRNLWKVVRERWREMCDQ